MITTSKSLHPPPQSVKELTSMFYLLLSMGMDGYVAITINGVEDMYLREDDVIASPKPKTFHFIAKDRTREVLYWYTEYACIMTVYNIYLEWCLLSDGRVIVGVWETRCDFPFVAILVYQPGAEEGNRDYCILYKVKDFRKLFPKVELLPTGEFDRSAAQRLV